ncbi:hypothetical protein LCGC14_1855960 [marine sediment metagenome]|uniref:Uncharacterized protein n=1 Tax=marine sediment metagenome TaxID=412755 RepID=A0A0F9G9E5_9ZZZZ
MIFIKRFIMKMLGGEWTAHYDYCNVFNEWNNPLTASGKPCSEDCANHPGSKVLLEKSGKIKEL